MTWTKDDPAQGSPAAIQGLAQLRSARAAKIRDAQQSLHAAATSSGEEWKAMSQPAFAAKLSADAADVELLATGLEAQASALQTYAGQLSQLKDRQRVLEQQRSSAQMDFGLTRLQVAASDSELPPLSPDPDVMSAAKRKAAAARTALEGAEAKIRGIDAQWDQLVADRRTIDSTCVAALQGDQVLGKLAGVTSSTIAGSTPAALMALVAGMSAIDLKILLQQHPELARALDEAAPSDVAQWWESLPQSEQDALVTGLPAVIGALNGIPALARVAANKINAQARLAAIDDELARQRKLASDTGSPQRFEEKIAALKDERGYLRLAVGAHPSVQLYLYDQAKDRIVEMVGTPSSLTKHVITYSPGTLADMQQFYDGDTQAIADWLYQNDQEGLVAFVYKDGRYPQNPLTEANDQHYAQVTGQRLAEFEKGLFQDPLLSNAISTGIGHSWGAANITSSESAGARYDQVISLSGAGTPAGWSKHPGTSYEDFSYDDILQDAQAIRIGDHGVVWDGRNPRFVGFGHDDYYKAPTNWKDIAGTAVGAWPFRLASGVDSHNLAASVDEANVPLLDDLRNYIYGASER